MLCDRLVRYVLVALWLAVFATETAKSTCAQTPAAASRSSEVGQDNPDKAATTRATVQRSPAELRALIAQLGDARFDVRESATRKLEAVGIEGVEPLLAAASGESLEVTSRAIRALGTIFESPDEATFDAVEIALEKLAESSNRSAARRAEVALEAQSDRRWRRAIVRIKALGGSVRTFQPTLSSRSRNVPRKIGTETDPDSDDGTSEISITLADKWTGGNAGLVNLRRLTGRPAMPVIMVTAAAESISPDAIDKLQQDVPELQLQHRGKAMLGVRSNRDLPLVVKEVTKGSAADSAGLKENDVIVKYDGEELKNFEQLIDITKRHKPGDEVTLVVLRGETRLELKAKLTGWNPEPEPEPIPKQPPTPEPKP